MTDVLKAGLPLSEKLMKKILSMLVLMGSFSSYASICESVIKKAVKIKAEQFYLAPDRATSVTITSIKKLKIQNYDYSVFAIELAVEGALEAEWLATATEEEKDTSCEYLGSHEVSND
jgi:hypothetical protein